MAGGRYPATGGGSPYWKDAVASSASLGTGSVNGEVKLTLDTNELYRWNTSGSTWTKILSASSVLGPASATDNAVARYDGTTGKLLQNSVVIIDDSGNITGAVALTMTGTLTLNTSLSGVLKATAGVVGTGQVALASEVSGVLPVANGGTNSNTALNSNRFMVSSGGAVVEAAAVTANRAVVSDANGLPTHSATTATQVGYLSGVTSDVQTQIDGKVAKAGDTMSGFLTLSADPNNALHAATKQYVDALLNGIRWKSPVRAATTANGTLATDFEDGDTLDGVTLATGDRILLKNQSTASENGIYVVAASGAPARATDADSFTELNGASVIVQEGTANANKGFMQTAELTALSDSQTWVQNFGTGLYQADGEGLELSGSTFGLELDGSTLSKSSSGLKVADQGISNAQINNSAGIARSKLATGTANRLVYNADTTGAFADLPAITASRAVVSDANGLPTHAATTATEIGHVAGVTSAIQTQIDAKLCATSVAAVSSDVTLTNKRIHFVDTSSARSLTLPSPSTSSFIVIKDKTGSCSTNNITVVRAASENIETVAASFVLNMDLGSWTFVSDGTDWFII